MVLLIIAVPKTSFDAKYYKEFWAAYDVPRHLFFIFKKWNEKNIQTENWKLEKIKPLTRFLLYFNFEENIRKIPFFHFGGILGAIST